MATFSLDTATTLFTGLKDSAFAFAKENWAVVTIGIGTIAYVAYRLIKNRQQSQIAAEIKTLHQSFAQFNSNFNLSPEVTNSEYFNTANAVRRAPVSDLEKHLVELQSKITLKTTLTSQLDQMEQNSSKVSRKGLTDITSQIDALKKDINQLLFTIKYESLIDQLQRSKKNAEDAFTQAEDLLNDSAAKKDDEENGDNDTGSQHSQTSQQSLPPQPPSADEINDNADYRKAQKEVAKQNANLKQTITTINALCDELQAAKAQDTPESEGIYEKGKTTHRTLEGQTTSFSTAVHLLKSHSLLERINPAIVNAQKYKVKNNAVDTLKKDQEKLRDFHNGLVSLDKVELIAIAKRVTAKLKDLTADIKSARTEKEAEAKKVTEAAELKAVTRRHESKLLLDSIVGGTPTKSSTAAPITNAQAQEEEETWEQLLQTKRRRITALSKQHQVKLASRVDLTDDENTEITKLKQEKESLKEVVTKERAGKETIREIQALSAQIKEQMNANHLHLLADSIQSFTTIVADSPADEVHSELAKRVADIFIDSHLNSRSNSPRKEEIPSSIVGNLSMPSNGPPPPPPTPEQKAKMERDAKVKALNTELADHIETLFQESLSLSLVEVALKKVLELLADNLNTDTTMIQALIKTKTKRESISSASSSVRLPITPSNSSSDIEKGDSKKMDSDSDAESYMDSELGSELDFDLGTSRAESFTGEEIKAHIEKAKQLLAKIATIKAELTTLAQEEQGYIAAQSQRAEQKIQAKKDAQAPLKDAIKATLEKIKLDVASTEKLATKASRNAVEEKNKLAEAVKACFDLRNEKETQSTTLKDQEKIVLTLSQEKTAIESTLAQTREMRATYTLAEETPKNDSEITALKENWEQAVAAETSERTAFDILTTEITGLETTIKTTKKEIIHHHVGPLDTALEEMLGPISTQYDETKPLVKGEFGVISKALHDQYTAQTMAQQALIPTTAEKLAGNWPVLLPKLEKLASVAQALIKSHVGLETNVVKNLTDIANLVSPPSVTTTISSSPLEAAGKAISALNSSKNKTTAESAYTCLTAIIKQLRQLQVDIRGQRLANEPAPLVKLQQLLQAQEVTHKESEIKKQAARTTIRDLSTKSTQAETVFTVALARNAEITEAQQKLNGVERSSFASKKDELDLEIGSLEMQLEKIQTAYTQANGVLTQFKDELTSISTKYAEAKKAEDLLIENEEEDNIPNLLNAKKSEKENSVNKLLLASAKHFTEYKALEDFFISLETFSEEGVYLESKVLEEDTLVKEGIKLETATIPQSTHNELVKIVEIFLQGQGKNLAIYYNKAGKQVPEMLPNTPLSQNLIDSSLVNQLGVLFSDLLQEPESIEKYVRTKLRLATCMYLVALAEGKATLTDEEKRVKKPEAPKPEALKPQSSPASEKSSKPSGSPSPSGKLGGGDNQDKSALLAQLKQGFVFKKKITPNAHKNATQSSAPQGE